MHRMRLWMSRYRRWATESQPLRSVFAVILHGYLLVVAGVGFLALISAIPAVRITAFSIEGNSAISTDRIVETIDGILATPYVYLIGKDMPLWAPQRTIAASVYGLDPHVSDVTVSGRFSRTLKVKVTEEVPAMLWCGSDVPTTTPDGGTCWFANERGTIYARAPEYADAPYPRFYTTPAPIFFDMYPRAHEYPIGYAIADEITMKHLETLRDAFPERGYEVASLGVTGDADVVVFTKDGTRFLMSLSRNILQDMKRFEALRDALHVRDEGTVFTEVDLRFDTKIYYR